MFRFRNRNLELNIKRGTIMKSQFTEAQKKIIVENHNLIYEFAKHRNLDVDDYYGVLAIGLCNAAKVFDESKGKFSTFAYKCMQNELYMHWRAMQKKSRIPQEMIVSYDAPLKNDESENDGYFIDGLADCYSACDITMDNIMLETFINSLDEKEKFIIQLLIEGETRCEIAAQLKCKVQNVCYYVSRIRKKWNKYNVY